MAESPPSPHTPQSPGAAAGAAAIMAAAEAAAPAPGRLLVPPSTKTASLASASFGSYSDDDLDLDEPESPDAAEDAKVGQFQKGKGGLRRDSVSAAPVNQQRLLHWQGPPVHPKSAEDAQQISTTIAESSALQVLFSHLSGESLQQVVGAFFHRDLEAGEAIIRQGDDGDFFYIVSSGIYDIYVQRGKEAPPQLVMTATAGSSFGELALMYNAPRAATVVCREPGCLWRMDRETFQMLIVTDANTRSSEYESFLRQIDVLSGLNRYELAKLSDLISEELFDGGEDIVAQGEEGDSVFFLQEGECKAYINGEHGEVEVKHYTQHGEYFGEIALITNEPRRATVRACGDGCVVLQLSRQDVDLSIGAMRERLLANIEHYPQYEALVH